MADFEPPYADHESTAMLQCGLRVLAIRRGGHHVDLSSGPFGEAAKSAKIAALGLSMRA